MSQGWIPVSWEKPAPCNPAKPLGWTGILPWPPFVWGSGENMARTLQLVRWVRAGSTGSSSDGDPNKTDPGSATCGRVTVGDSVTLSEFPFPHRQAPCCRVPGARKHLAHCRCSSSQGCYELLAVVLGVGLLGFQLPQSLSSNSSHCLVKLSQALFNALSFSSSRL